MDNSERRVELSTYPQPGLLRRGGVGFVIVDRVVTPGMIGGRDGGGALFFEDAVEIFGVDNLGLVILFVEDAKFEWFGFVEQGNLASCVFANDDLGIAQGIGGALGLDLVDYLLELDGEVLGEQALFLPGQDLVEIFKACQGAVSIVLAARGHAKALIEIGDKLG